MAEIKQKVKNFSKSKLSFPTPHLLTMQRETWEDFWKVRVKELLEEISPIRDYTGKEMELWFGDYKLSKPNYKNGLEAKKNNDSLESSLRVKVKLVNLKTKEVKEQEVYLADFPVMTERGTFVVNGVERVVVSQLIRSPGAFFTARLQRGKNYFGSKIIPNRGAWLEFETEESGFIGVKINRKRKVPATTLLMALGLDNVEKVEKEFKDVDTGEIQYIKETLKRDTCKDQKEALVEVYRRLRPGDLVTPDTAQDLIFNMFFNFDRYDLSKVGRWKTGQRLPVLAPKNSDDITKEERILSIKDLVEVVKEVIRLNNDPAAKPDQVDHLGNRRVRTLSELIQNRLRVGLMRMERIIKDKMSTLEADTITPIQLINPRPLMAVVKEFYTSSQFSQFMDNENPLAELEHKRRLTTTGPGGLTRERAGFEVRDVQPSHYGRICPIETPEGPNVGLVGHLATFAKINPYGFIEAPYFKVKNGKVTDQVEYLSAQEEERHSIVPASVPLNESGKILAEIPPDKVEARVKGEPAEVDISKIDYCDVSSKQFISVAASLIPFLQNDDASRALMGSNMQRQAVPLIKPEAPLVGTGTERNVARDSGQGIIADANGIVKEVDAQHIKVQYEEKSLPAGRQGKKWEEDYELQTFVRTNQYSCFHQKPIVTKGEEFKKGDVLADGAAISHGRLALGRNVLVCFLPLRGGGFEDSITISERLGKEDEFTSIHIEDFTCDVRETKLGPEVTTSDIPNVGEEKLKDLDEEGIVRVGAEVGPNDILVGKISPKGEAELTPEERLLRAIFGEKAKDVKDSSLRMEHGKKGKVTNVKIFSRDLGHKLEPGVIKRIQVEIAETRKAKVGDKLVGRHGNKGVVSRILAEHEMPFLADGTPVDLVISPLSVPSRMNLGQILETHLGWAAHKLNYIAISPALLGANKEDVKKELKEAGLPESGQVTVYDGRTGQPFPKPITVGYMYVMKLIHMVDDKVHARSIGPYSLITQQPLGGKAQFGGQRFGEMEVWALEGYGVAHTLQEMLTIKSDDVQGRAAAYESILKGEPIRNPNIPASFNLLVAELKSLGMSVEVREKPRLARDDERENRRDNRDKK
ncbi:MAG: DNA-directed RNA polymerase subunit beta [Candidatus Staskawiczbacteria bacterium RIFOXYB1_FULL_37_44]|uniref:DNA-directed RNA polymerase subunit beta n=1 Tax=Candidatus Staskawiczbacteria bacterium RIFOXYB1_FULL_37_44 TaxID=1802223 RepID=A0A1G2IV74_9BACT|nr:MAG: DNA-directed RNA polymerase subunit beta [Candidatus Staskawiczbacteria bacterium RIFOXYB1_FULL_37_44]OGZ83452.1 MAG: DNA-directed RNA polymerase subunit beta [Candidatus Staskawiczbacteria bacterium RIFOXYC1_FULL_37_52]OGZ88896.1 MAG: DNA-directed RNA polymerase subunit beta [Candidatus Staskawiczbacteria bacterium RIFOXYD1_FULL_37_110]